MINKKYFLFFIFFIFHFFYINLSFSAWEVMETPTTEDLYDICCVNSNIFLVIGDNGTILLLDPDYKWKKMTLETSENLYGSWVNENNSTIYVVGSQGIILFLDVSNTNQWKIMESNTDIVLKDVYGISNNLYAVGEAGTILHYSDNLWEKMDCNTINTLNCIWGTSNTNIYACGDNNTIIHYNGYEWKDINTEINYYGDYKSIWGTLPDNIYIAGNNAGNLHFDGNKWDNFIDNIKFDYIELDSFNKIYGKFESLYIVGTQYLLFYENNTWSDEIISNHKSINSIYISSNNDRFLVGEDGSIYKFKPKLSKFYEFDNYINDEKDNTSEPVKLSIYLNNQVLNEDDGYIKNAGKVTLSDNFPSDVKIIFSTNPENQIEIFPVTIPAKKGYTVFDLIIKDDIEKPQIEDDINIVIEAKVENNEIQGSSTNFLLKDNEKKEFAISFNKTIVYEGATLTGTVSIPGTYSESDLDIELISSPQYKIKLETKNVIIKSGVTFVNFGIDTIDDDYLELEYTTPIQISTSAKLENWTEGTKEFFIIDNENRIIYLENIPETLTLEDNGKTINCLVAIEDKLKSESLKIQLISNQPDIIEVDKVTIEPEQITSTFPMKITIPDPSLINSVQISAASEGWPATMKEIVILVESIIIMIESPEIQLNNSNTISGNILLQSISENQNLTVNLNIPGKVNSTNNPEINNGAISIPFYFEISENITFNDNEIAIITAKSSNSREISETFTINKTTQEQPNDQEQSADNDDNSNIIENDSNVTIGGKDTSGSCFINTINYSYYEIF